MHSRSTKDISCICCSNTFYKKMFQKVNTAWMISKGIHMGLRKWLITFRGQLDTFFYTKVQIQEPKNVIKVLTHILLTFLFVYKRKKEIVQENINVSCTQECMQLVQKMWCVIKFMIHHYSNIIMCFVYCAPFCTFSLGDGENSLLLFARSFNIPKVFSIYKMKWVKSDTFTKKMLMFTHHRTVSPWIAFTN